jgi:uncharacterized protein (DUF58 family)
MGKYRTLYAAAVGTAVLGYVLSDRAEALALICVLLLVPCITGGLQAYAMRQAQLQCQVRPACHQGQTVPIAFVLTRRHKVPMGVVHVELELQNCLFQEVAHMTFALQTGEEKTMTFSYPFSAQDCGAVKIRVSSLAFYDLMGLFCWHRSPNLSTELRVYPPELPLHTKLSQASETKNFGQIYDPYKKGQDVSEVAGLRDYVPGDPVHSIHWKLSGKLDKTIIREFGSPSDYNTLILYELTDSDGKDPVSHSRNNAVLALTAALSLSMLKISLEHQVGRVYDKQLHTMPVTERRAHEQMVDDLLYHPVGTGEDGTNTVFVFLRGNAKASYTKIIYVTPVYREKALRRLADGVDLIVLHVVEGKGLSMTTEAGYAIVPVDAQTYTRDISNLVL